MQCVFTAPDYERETALKTYTYNKPEQIPSILIHLREVKLVTVSKAGHSA